jgi:hypothetical protein
MSEIVPARVRAQRLSSGKCPSHGTVLVNAGPFVESDKQVGFTYGCPDTACKFEVVARYGSGMHKLLR